MPMVPMAVYELIRDKARSRARLTERAEERLQRARARAYSLPGMRMDADRVQQSSLPDKIPCKVAAVIEAEEALAQARLWVDVFVEMDRCYPPSGDGPGMVAALYFGSGLTMMQIADTLHISRQTVLDRRTEWVINAAIRAAQKGLIAAPLE